MLNFARRDRLSAFDTHIDPQSSCGYSRRARIHDERERLPARSRQHPERRRNKTAPFLGYSLEFVAHPPREVQLGSPINQDVTLLVRAAQPQQWSSSKSNASLHEYFAVASLIGTTDNTVAPQGTLAGPKLADSIRDPETIATDAVDPSVMGYVSFPHLCVQDLGSYRLRITLMRVNGLGLCSPSQSAHTLQAIESECIQVTGGQYNFCQG